MICECYTPGAFINITHEGNCIKCGAQLVSRAPEFSLDDPVEQARYQAIKQKLIEELEIPALKAEELETPEGRATKITLDSKLIDTASDTGRGEHG